MGVKNTIYGAGVYLTLIAAALGISCARHPDINTDLTKGSLLDRISNAYEILEKGECVDWDKCKDVVDDSGRIVISGKEIRSYSLDDKGYSHFDSMRFEPIYPDSMPEREREKYGGILANLNDCIDQTLEIGYSGNSGPSFVSGKGNQEWTEPVTVTYDTRNETVRYSYSNTENLEIKME